VDQESNTNTMHQMEQVQTPVQAQVLKVQREVVEKEQTGTIDTTKSKVEIEARFVSDSTAVGTTINLKCQ
jgi:hypothetical protein